MKDDAIFARERKSQAPVLTQIDSPFLTTDEVARLLTLAPLEIPIEYNFGYFIFIPIINRKQIKFLGTMEEGGGDLWSQRTTGDAHTQVLIECKQQSGRR